LSDTAAWGDPQLLRPTGAETPNQEEAMPTSIDERHKVISERDESFAFELAKLLMDKPKPPVWIILLPMLFVFYGHWLKRYRANLDTFSDGYLHTKRLALDTAMSHLGNGGMAADGWNDLLGAQPVERAVVREGQIRELDLLMDHYSRMLGSPGQDYAEMLRGAYGTSGEYRFFLNRLTRVEEEINRAVLEVDHPTEEARDVVERMQRYSDRLREEELTRVFG
jgi:hypothetical protein